MTNYYQNNQYENKDDKIETYLLPPDTLLSLHILFDIILSNVVIAAMMV